MTMTNAAIPTDGPDRLAGAVLADLQRRMKRVRVGGAVRGAVLAGLTFGIWPLIAWPRRLRDQAKSERQQLWHLYEWIRLRGGYPESELKPLKRAAEGVGFRLSLWLVALIVIGLVASFFGRIGSEVGLDLRDFIRVTYQYGKRAPPVGLDQVRAMAMNRAWIVGLAFAYGLHWVHVQLYCADLRRFARVLNSISRREGVAAVRLPRLGIGFGLGWMVAGMVLWWLGAGWGIPLALAGVAHQRLAQTAGPRMRAELAETLRSMLLIRRPAMQVPALVQPSQRCANPKCGARIPAFANFCPRCGTSLHGTVNQGP